MAVYREGYNIAELITKASVRIFNDAADYGAPVKKGDKLWNAAKQLADWYGEGETVVNRYSTGRSADKKIILIDEWAVSDERKTLKEATEVYTLSFVSCTTGRCKGYDGYITLYK